MYDGSYTMAAKPIRSLKLHYTFFKNKLYTITVLKNPLSFVLQISRIYESSTQSERIESALSLLNDETEELKILEATKLLMYDAAVQLHRSLSKGEDVPVFGMLLFARDSCECPRDLLINHLNRTGDTGGLEQVIVSSPLSVFPPLGIWLLKL